MSDTPLTPREMVAECIRVAMITAHASARASMMAMLRSYDIACVQIACDRAVDVAMYTAHTTADAMVDEIVESVIKK